MSWRSTIGVWHCTGARQAFGIKGCWSPLWRGPANTTLTLVLPSVIEMAALYTAGIVRNHPFVDGNKRTGFVVGVLFLELNGFDFKASEVDATQAVMGLAAATLDEAGYVALAPGKQQAETRKIANVTRPPALFFVTR